MGLRSSETIPGSLRSHGPDPAGEAGVGRAAAERKIGIPASSAAGGSEPGRRGPHWGGTGMTNGGTGSDTHKGGRGPTPPARRPGKDALGGNHRSTSKLDSDGASLAASGRSAGPGL